MKAVAGQSNRSVLELLVQAGANIEIRNNEGNTALLLTKSCEIASFLLEHRANSAAQDNTGSTALIKAVLSDDIELITLLVSKGAPLETINNNGDTALSQAVRQGTWDKRIDTIRYLLNAGAKIETLNKQGNTPLIEAAIEGNPAIAELLMQLKANVKAKNFAGQTAVDVALKTYHRKFAEKLDPSIALQPQTPSTILAPPKQMLPA